MTFEMVGILRPVKDTEKFKGYEENSSPKGYQGKTLRFNLISGTNKHLLSLKSWVKKDGVIYSFSKPNADGKGESLQIPFQDRLKQEVVDAVADFKKFTVALEEEKFHYISEWDFIDKLGDILHSDTYKNKKFKIKGNVVTTYNDETNRWYISYIPQKIYLVSDSEDEYAKLNSVIYINKDSLDISESDDTGKAYISAYTREYDAKRKEFLPYPISFTFSKENPELDKKFEFWKKKFQIKGNEWKEFGVVADIINGSERKEITLDMLDDEQKEEIELGLISLEDIQKEMGGSIVGNFVSEYRLSKIMRGYSTGTKETVYTDEDFTIKPVATTVVDKTKDVAITVNDIEDLFDDEL